MTPGDYLLGSLVLALGASIGLMYLYAGVAWIRLLDYRITATHLELTLAGRATLQRVPLLIITETVIFGERLSLRPCLWFHVSSALQPWKTHVWRMERWGNRACGPFVIVRRSAGRDIILTPADPLAFIVHLDRARRSMD